MMRFLIVLALIVGTSGRLQAQIVPVYEGSTGVRDNVLSVCVQCHSTTLSGGARKNAPAFVNFNTYADAILWGADAVAQVNARLMPPAGTAALSSEQRAAFVAWQAAGFPERATAAADTQAPTTPAKPTATVISTTEINLAWSAATDDVAVTAYKIYRDGNLITTLGNTTIYVDKKLSAATAYSFSVAACDAAGNCSAQSTPASATTPQQSDCLFNWAEASFPDYFAPRTQSQSAPPYYGRVYPPGTVLAIGFNKLLYLGPLSSGAVLDLGDLATWYPRAGCN